MQVLLFWELLIPFKIFAFITNWQIIYIHRLQCDIMIMNIVCFVCCFLIEYTHIDHVIYFLGRVLYSWRLCWKSRHLPQEVVRYVLWNKKGGKLFSKNPNKIFNMWVVKYVNHFLRKAFQTLPYSICMDSGFSVLPVRIHADIFCPGYNPWSLWSRQTPVFVFCPLDIIGLLV